MTYKASDHLYGEGTPPQAQITGWDDDTSSFNVVRVDQSGRMFSNQYVWETSLMAWVPAETTGGVSIVGVTDATDTRINPATEESLQSLVGFEVPPHDYISLGYTGTDLTSVTYKTGGSSGTTVATLTLGYSGSNLVSVTRS